MPKLWSTLGPGGVSMLDGERLVKERPLCAQLIGAIIVEWSSAEANLAHYYGFFVAGPSVSGIPQAPAQWVAFETFDMLVSFQQRQKMLIAAAKRRGFDKATVKELNKHLNILHKTCDERIIAAHGRWGIDPRVTTGVVWTKTVGGISDAMIYEPDDFRRAVAAINKANWDLHTFFYATFFPRLEAEAKAHVAHIQAAKNIEGAV